MLNNTFVHIPGISKETELELWKQDVYTWEEFLDKKSSLVLDDSKKQQIEAYLKESLSAKAAKDYSFFLKSLGMENHWRLYRELKDKCCFLDIETTGLDKDRNRLTLIGIYDGKESKFFINGINLQDFEDEIKKYDLIITFNGRAFDLPFIQSKFPSVDFNKFHIDLRYVLRDIGYTGGLKRIEHDLNISRSDEIQGMDGRHAVTLWHRYERGDSAALQQLLKYNRADIENLKTLMEFAFSRKKEKEFLGKLNL